MKRTEDLLRRLPKAELHCHLDGSVRPQTLLDLAAEYGAPMPKQDVESLAAYMRVRDGSSLERYLERFSITLSVMQRAPALERIAYELAVDAAADGVRYIEVRYSPVLNAREGLSLGETVEAPLRGLARAERDTGIVARLIICGLRTLSPDISLELAELAVGYQKRGVVAFDLAGAEAGYRASDHKKAFAHAHAHHLCCTCHAGEGDGPASVRDALDGCGADRVGHGTRIIEDAQLLDDVIERQVPIEVCLTSNVQTHAAASYGAHPLRTFYDRGVNVVLNTDNRLMSGTTLTDEYLHAERSLGFTFDELSRMALNGFRSAFLPEDERRGLIARAEQELAALRSEAA